MDGRGTVGVLTLGTIVGCLLCLFGGYTGTASASRSARSSASAVVPAALGIAVSPQPGTVTANPDAQISFLGVPADDIRGLVVRGTVSGRHAGRLASYAAATGASFLPARVGFQPGERVAVSADIGGVHPGRIAFSFTISRPAPLPAGSLGLHPPAPKPGQVQTFQTRPDLKPPAVTVAVNKPGTAGGDLFLAPIGGPGALGPMLLDPSARLVYFHPVSNGVAMDFKLSHYQGRPVLTWWQGPIVSPGIGFGEHVIVDDTYRTIATVQAGNGYLSDLHDFHILADGSALLTAYAPERRSLRFIGGAANAVVLDSVVQRIDIKTGLVMYEWHAMQRVGLAESHVDPPNGSQSFPFDFFHVNSVQLEPSGHLLISARNTWAAYEVDPLTSRIVWRLGGKRSNFKMGPRAQFSWQHDVRLQPNGTITVFDDGAAPKVEAQSRGEVLRLDLSRHAATVAAQFTHPTPLLAGSQGNVQALPNADDFVGWGQVNYLSEFSPSGQLLFDAYLPAPGESYRAFRFPWHGRPPNAPNLKATPSGPGKLSIYVSWNGATDVASWRVLAGGAPATGQMAPVATAPSGGFETAISATTGMPYVAVQAIDAGGRVLGTSLPVKV